MYLSEMTQTGAISLPTGTPGWYEIDTPRQTPPHQAKPGLQNFFFRFLDVVIAGAALTFFLPVMLVILVCIRVSDGASGIFRQRRVGVGGRYFWCLKFRSMVIDADVRLAQLLDADPEAMAEWTRDQKLKRDPRITPFGRFLRKSSLDELPQLLNVIRGDMSIIGPRPIVPGEVDRYGRYFAHYITVKPGLTGLWQVSGRNNLTYRRRVALDVTYVRKRSIQLYILILVRTFPAVLCFRGCS